MKITELFTLKRPVVSFEIFPPKPEYPVESIFDTLNGLRELKPDFVSVTYGAGGSSSARSIEIASAIQNDYKLETLAHLTCVGATRNEIDHVLEQFQRCGVRNILALRGDAPQGQSQFTPVENGYAYATDLVAHIRKQGGFSIAAAAYPEGHAECADSQQAILHLKQKVDTGTDFLITQLFFENTLYYRFWDAIREAGVTCPISVGILPVLNAGQIRRITALCGASVPAALQRLMDQYGDKPAEMEKAGIHYACEQIVDLLDRKVDGIHLYTMNKAHQSKQIMQQTGLRS